MLLSVKKKNLNLVSFSLKQAQISANGARKIAFELRLLFLPHWQIFLPVLSKIIIFFFCKQEWIIVPVE